MNTFAEHIESYPQHGKELYCFFCSKKTHRGGTWDGADPFDCTRNSLVVVCPRCAPRLGVLLSDIAASVGFHRFTPPEQYLADLEREFWRGMWQTERRKNHRLMREINHHREEITDGSHH